MALETLELPDMTAEDRGLDLVGGDLNLNLGEVTGGGKDEGTVEKVGLAGGLVGEKTRGERGEIDLGREGKAGFEENLEPTTHEARGLLWCTFRRFSGVMGWTVRIAERGTFLLFFVV